MNIDILPNITVGKYQWWGTNHAELIGIKNEIFNQSIYLPTSDFRLSSSPCIIDAGAHVGLATLFFKLQYPDAKITCVEPHPVSVEILKHNIWFNRLTGIEVVGAALSDQSGTRTLHTDDSEDAWYSTTGKPGSWDQHQITEPIVVPTITLDSLIANPIDLVKMDIEGAEEQVLRASHKIDQIDNLILELHPPTTPEDIQNIFKRTHTLRVEKHHFGLKLCYLSKNGASARIRT